MAGPVSGIAATQRLLLELGPRRGYFHEPAKSILIALIATPPSALNKLLEFNFHQLHGHRYIGGFVGSGAAKAAWVGLQVLQWVRGVHALAKVAHCYPQTACVGLTQSLQAKWQYLQCVTPNIVLAFAPLEDGTSQGLPPGSPRHHSQRSGQAPTSSCPPRAPQQPWHLGPHRNRLCHML